MVLIAANSTVISFQEAVIEMLGIYRPDEFHGGFNVAHKSTGKLVDFLFSACLALRVSMWKTYSLASATL